MNLRTRILVTYLGLAITGIVITGFSALWMVRSSLDAQLTRTQERELKLVSSALASATFTAGSREDRNQLLRLFASNLSARLTLIDKQGVVVFDSEMTDGDIRAAENHADRPEIAMARAGRTGVHQRRSESVGVSFQYAAARIVSPSLGGMDSGFVRIALPLESIESEENRLAVIFLGAGAIALLVSTLVGILVSNRISAPVLDIVRTVNRIRDGDVEARVTKSYPAELGELARSVNNMAQKLSSDIATLERLGRMRSEFLGNVSHELRTPLFSLQGYLETLIDGAVDDPEVKHEFLEKAHRHADRLNTLLGDLIEISRIESGEMKMSFRYFSVLEFLQGILEEMEPAAQSKGLSLSLDVGFDAAAKVYGDRARLQQALVNLIDNAIKYTDPGGSVICRARPVLNRCEILVEDTGCGIAEEHLPRIFERFYRVDKDRSREVGGTGLGLSIAKHIVEAHGGTLQVRSRVAEGSTFSFSLKR
jgi:two-component system phosphate regulon sensor histidine kinase PhoR